MSKGTLLWLLWYVQMLAEGATLQPETHNLAREKIAHDLEPVSYTHLTLPTSDLV